MNEVDELDGRGCAMYALLGSPNDRSPFELT